MKNMIDIRPLTVIPSQSLSIVIVTEYAHALANVAAVAR